MKVSKDGEKFFDIDDSDDSVAAAKAKGYQEYLPMTKNGKDVFNVLASEDSYKAAIGKGYQDADMFKYQHKKDAPEVGTGEAALRGAAQGFGGGFADELSGAAGAVVNPTDSDKGFMDRYRDSRDYARGRDAAGMEQHPVATIAGNVVGGVGSAALIPGAATLKGSIGLGAAAGLGGSNADLTKPSLENAGEALKDTALGGAGGAAGYGLGKAVGAGVNVARQGKAGLEGLARGAEAGAEAAPLQNVPGIGTASRLWGAVKGALGESDETGAAKAEVSAIANEARAGLAAEVQAPSEASPLRIRRLQDLQAFGNGKSIEKFSDDEAILAALMDKGDNPTKRWVAQKAATLQPGQIDQDQYGKILGMGHEARTAAREFDPREAAKSLKGSVEDVQDLFKSARNSRFNELQEAARGSFDPQTVAPVVDHVEEAIADASRMHSAKPAANILADVHGMVTNGTGTRLQGLTPGDLTSATPAEQFNRLQKARELLDEEIKWGKETKGQGAKLLGEVRDSIDQALKFSQEKVDADALYHSSKGVEGKFFGATQFRDPTSGSIDVDEGKLSRLLGNTDQANRFKESMQGLNEFADRPDLADEFKTKAKGLIADLQKHIDVAEQKRDMGALRQANGPTSPAVERLGSVTRGNTLVQDAVQSPAGFTNQVDQFNKTLKTKLGKGFEALDEGDKAAATKYFIWLQKNPGVGQATADSMFAKLFGGAP